jgi:hypothetical protein
MRLPRKQEVPARGPLSRVRQTLECNRLLQRLYDLFNNFLSGTEFRRHRSVYRARADGVHAIPFPAGSFNLSNPVSLTLGNADQSGSASGSDLHVPIGLCRAYANRTDELAIEDQRESAGHLHKA